MTVKTASCPGCGATLEFHNAATLFVVCPFCGGASSREDARLELLGKVAAVADIDSVLSIGACGTMGLGKDGHPARWRAVGQVQLDHGLGPWNEWCLAFENGTWAWLAEAQGELLLTRDAGNPGAPDLASLSAGEDVFLGDYGRFTVAEVGEGTVTAVKGELPVVLSPGEKVHYADLRGPDGGFGTLDYGAGEVLDAVYLGKAVAVEALGIDASTVAERAPKEIAARRLQCPKCGAAIDVRDPRNTVRVVCGSCGALLDPRKSNLEVIEIAARLAVHPSIPIGSVGTLRGLKVEVIAFLVRSVHVDGVRYPWREYLLKVEHGGFRWLVEANGHWNFVEPANLGDVRRTGLIGGATWKGERFAHFQGGKARVDHVQGEVYWEVSVGEEVRSDDFVDPPRMLSFEGTGKEQVVSLGDYLTRDEVVEAFQLKTPLPSPTGIAPNQPNPYAEGLRRWGAAYGLLAAAAVVLMIVFHARAAKEVVLDKELAATEGEQASEVFTSDEFTLHPGSGNVEVEIEDRSPNSWVGLDGDLVNLETGDVHSFEVDAETWAGVEDGEAWSEGSAHGSVYLSEVPAGRYALRIDPVVSSAGMGKGAAFHVRVTSQVPSTWRVLWILLSFSVIPLARWIAKHAFERRRWADSDHPGGPSFTSGSSSPHPPDLTTARGRNEAAEGRAGSEEES